MLEGIDEDAVDFAKTTTDRKMSRCFSVAFKPAVQRAAGIAVGMATSIPPTISTMYARRYFIFLNSRMLPLPSSWNWCPDRIFRLVAF